MSSEGKALAFHLKYYPEMMHYYWNEEAKHPDAKVQGKIEAVAKAADAEGHKFVEESIKRIYAHIDDMALANIGRLKIYRKRGDWRREVIIYPKKAGMKPIASMGILIQEESAVSWVWRAGPVTQSTDVILKALKNHRDFKEAKRNSERGGEEDGSINFEVSYRQLLENDPLGLELSKISEKIVEPLLRITPNQLENIIKM